MAQGVNGRYGGGNGASRARAQPPATGARDSRGHRRCYTRVQEIARGGKLRVWRFRSWNRGEWGSLPHRSKQSDSGAPSTSTGQSQLWKLTKCNRRNRAGVDSASFENCTLSIGRGDGTNGSRRAESGPVSRSLPVLALRRRLGRSPGPGRLTTQVGAGNHPGQDATPTTHRLTLLCVVRWRSPLRRRPATGRWSPRQLVHLPAVCRDSSDPGSRRRVCTIATRNKTSHRSAQQCGPLQAVPS